MFARLALLLFLTTCILSPLEAQSTVPVRDPNAVALAGSALQALDGGTALADITMVGTATYIAGSDQETVPGVMKGLGTASSSVQLSLAAGAVTEIRNYAIAPRAAAWSGGDGTAQPIALHNCWTEAVWFFPALGVLAQTSDPQLSFVYMGAATHNGVPVLQVRSYRVITNQDPDVITTVQDLSTVDVYLDPSSLLPEFVTFASHPDSNFNIAIPVEIDFADYRSVGKARVPFHVLRFEQGVLKLDFVVASAAVNSGLSASAFSLQ